MTFDVAIAGGGPAAATAGLLLARAGVRTIVVVCTTRNAEAVKPPVGATRVTVSRIPGRGA